MRIMVVAFMNPTSADYPLFLSDYWKAMGHEVDVVPVDLELYNDSWFHIRQLICGHSQSCFLDHISKRVLQRSRLIRPDILLIMGHVVSARVLLRIRREIKCTVGYLLDHNHLMMGDTTEVMRQAGFVIAHDSYLLPLIKGTTKGRNPNVFLMLGAADVREHLPVKLSAEDREHFGPNIAFVGGASAFRVQALSRLAPLGIRIWGRPHEWRGVPELVPFVHDEPVYGLKKTKIYNASAIVLSIEDPEKQLNSLNSRVPEVLACGGFVLSNWSKDLEDAGFRDGESVVWFHSLEEMVEKATFYLARQELRQEISRRGGELVHQRLTWERVAGGLIEQMTAVRQADSGSMTGQS